MRYLFLSLVIASMPVVRASDLSDLGQSLSSMPCFSADARCEIMLPNSDTPVVYDLRMMSAATADTLAPCDYLIDWTVTTPAGSTGSGFTAYSGGNHFRYRDGRLQEYHFSDDSIPFRPGGNKERGVQSRAQFVDFLPQTIGRILERMAADTAYDWRVDRRDSRLIVRGTERTRGYVCREFSYTFDASTLLPVEIAFDSNPGQPSEQSLVMTYTRTAASGCAPVTEESLAATFPDAFGKYRRDTYRLEHLPGMRMPTFSAPTPTGERFTYNQGDPMGSPTVIAILDTSVADTDSVVADLRQASLLSSLDNRLILAFIDSDIERVDRAAGALRPGEAILMGARRLARDCGVTDTPSLIFCAPDGRVTDIMIGRNNRLTENVIQKIALAR